MSKRRPRKNAAENKMVSRLDNLAKFEEFEESILPMLRKALQSGKGAEDILKMANAHAAARMVTIAMTEKDSQKVMSSLTQILDRTVGKATEKHQIEHKYAALKDDELDALILSEVSDAELVSDNEDTE
jgi:hypothetical protein